MIDSWSPQQAAALGAVGRWIADPTALPIFRLFGYAGTGKTTLARHLATSCRAPIFAAFTGKAASVLREKGCTGATTIHSLMYNVSTRDRSVLTGLRVKLMEMDERHPDYAETKFDFEQEQDKVRRPWFHVNPESVLTAADLIIIDEVSMVDARVGKDLLSFGKKILVLGDPAQLPPIAGGGYFTNATPDVLLTEIHRQALDNPILRWATLVREGGLVPYGDEGTARKLRRDRVDDPWLAGKAGQILCGKNETRRALNQRIRKQLGRTNPFPVFRDTLVMLQNDHRLGILNGTLGRCQSTEPLVQPDGNVCLNIAYDRKILFDLVVDPCAFLGKECTHERQRDVLQMDYGYALTVHKAQGSQWDDVTLYDDGFAKRDPEQRRRWLYTAITRAAKRLTIVTS